MFGLPYNLNCLSDEVENLLEKNIKVSASLEDYLEAIYKIIEEKNSIKAVEISRRLGVGRSSVTEALKTLADKNLVNYNRYDTISLTKEGEKVAKRVILKHNTLFDFFNKILGLSPDESDKNACKVEHVISEKAAEKFSEFVEFISTSKYDIIKDFKKTK